MAKTAVAGYNMQLVEMAMAYQRSRVLCAAARLGVADLLGDGEGAAGDLAAACKADAAALRRLLRAMAGMGLVRETAPGTFTLTDMGRPLRKDVPGSAWAGIIFWADFLSGSWDCLTDCVRTGKNAAVIRPELMTRWQQDSEGPDIFRAVMGTSPAEDYMAIANAWDFSKTGTVADLGGGGGALIDAILASYPGVRGMLVDRPESITAAESRFTTGPHAGRCELIAADLTEKVPHGADVYILKHVLHGNTDAAAIDILENCLAVLPPHGCVLIIEFILPDVIDQADRDLELRLLSDLNMLAVTLGKERSALEWTKLLEGAGLRCEGILPVAGDLVSIIEARPR